MTCKTMSSQHRLLLSAHRLKSKSGIDTLPSSSGAFLCLLESGEPLAFWFSTPNRVRVRMDSRGRTATAMGKLILGETGTGQQQVDVVVFVVVVVVVEWKVEERKERKRIGK